MDQIDIIAGRNTLRGMAQDILNAPGEHVSITFYAKNNELTSEEIALVFSNEDCGSPDDDFVVDVS